MSREWAVRIVAVLNLIGWPIAGYMAVKFFRHYDDVPVIAREATDAEYKHHDQAIYNWAGKTPWATSVAVVNVSGRIKGCSECRFVKLFEVVNPTSEGSLWDGPGQTELQAEMTNYSAGTIRWHIAEGKDHSQVEVWSE